MPIYEYVCGACGKKTELIQRMNAAAPRICPFCGGKKLKKAFSAPAIQFKGSGFYITDYSRGSGDGPPKKGGAEKSEGKAEKTEKSEKADSAGKAEKAKSESAGKSDKVEKKTEKKAKKSGD
jgi:putative FmdB family regulatory protein